MGGVKRRVLKFGGTSVGAAAPLGAALGIVERALGEAPVVVVVSALSGVTDALEAALAGAASGGLDASHFTRALRERHLALVRAVASGRAATRATTEIVARLSALEELPARRSPCSGRSTPAERASVLAVGRAALGPDRRRRPALARHSRPRVFDAAALVRTDAAWSEAAVDFPATRQLVHAALGALPQGARCPWSRASSAAPSTARRRFSAAAARTTRPPSWAGRSTRSASRSGRTCRA